MEEQNIGQGIQSLIPPKKTSDNQYKLEEKIGEKIKEAVSFSSFSEKKDLLKNEVKENETINILKSTVEENKEKIIQDEIKNEDDSQKKIQETKREEQLKEVPREQNQKEEQESIIQSSNIKSEEISQIAPINFSKKEEKIFHIEVEKIKSSTQQPRSIFHEESLKELASSIREFGILEPLIVFRKEIEVSSGTQIEYELIAGERRLLAAKMLNLITVPVLIRQAPEERQKLELALIENIQREDLTPIAKARAFSKLINDFGLTQQALSERIGKSREVIANSLRLLQLPQEAQKALEEGRINEGHGRSLLLLPSPEKRRALLQEIFFKNLSGRESEDLAKKYLLSDNRQNNTNKERRQNLSSSPQDLEVKEKLEEILKTPVSIKRKGETGEVVIKFFTDTDLQQIMTKFLN